MGMLKAASWNGPANELRTCEGRGKISGGDFSGGEKGKDEGTRATHHPAEVAARAGLVFGIGGRNLVPLAKPAGALAILGVVGLVQQAKRLRGLREVVSERLLTRGWGESLVDQPRLAFSQRMWRHLTCVPLFLTGAAAAAAAALASPPPPFPFPLPLPPVLSGRLNE